MEIKNSVKIVKYCNNLLLIGWLELYYELIENYFRLFNFKSEIVENYQFE